MIDDIFSAVHDVTLTVTADTVMDDMSAIHDVTLSLSLLTL